MTMLKPALLVLVTFGLLLTMHGPLSVTDRASASAPMLDCFAAAEHEAGLEDGIGGVIFARFVNAARFTRSDAQHVVVELAPWDPLDIQPSANNLAWFDDGYRHRKHRLNFVATHLLPKAGLAYLRERVGAPDRIFMCPSMIDAPGELELWVYDGAEQQARLASFVTHDPMAHAFLPRTKTRAFRFEPAWAMVSPDAEAKLVGDDLVWTRGDRVGDWPVVVSKPIFLAPGHYRLRLDAAVVNPAVLPAQVHAVVRGVVVARAPLAPSVTSTSIELDVGGRGGPTSGDDFHLLVTTGEATDVRVEGAELELVEATGVDLLRLFR